MIITNPKLPPLTGFVEVENDAGESVYEKLPEQAEKETLQQDLVAVKEQLAQADDAAIELFEAQAAQAEVSAQQDEAIIDLYTRIGG